MTFYKNNKYYEDIKLIELKYFCVKEEVQKQMTLIKYINTNVMIVDSIIRKLL